MCHKQDDDDDDGHGKRERTRPQRNKFETVLARAQTRSMCSSIGRVLFFCYSRVKINKKGMTADGAAAGGVDGDATY